MFRFLIELFINLLIVKFFLLDISYDQNHWFPVALIIILGIFISSVIYRISIDGNAMNISIIIGSVVQNISVELFSIFSIDGFFFIVIIIQYVIIDRLMIKIIFNWSLNV